MYLPVQLPHFLINSDCSKNFQYSFWGKSHFFWDLSHDFLAEYYYKPSIFASTAAKLRILSDSGQLFEASNLFWCKQRSQFCSCKTKHNCVPDALHEHEMRCLGEELKMRCLLLTIKLPSKAVLVLFVSIQTQGLHLKRYRDLLSSSGRDATNKRED